MQYLLYYDNRHQHFYEPIFIDIIIVGALASTVKSAKRLNLQSDWQCDKQRAALHLSWFFKFYNYYKNFCSTCYLRSHRYINVDFCFITKCLKCQLVKKAMIESYSSCSPTGKTVLFMGSSGSEEKELTAA